MAICLGCLSQQEQVTLENGETLLQEQTRATGRICTLSCGFGQGAEGSQPWAGGEMQGDLSLPACRTEAAELLRVEGTCAGYTPYARAC